MWFPSGERHSNMVLSYKSKKEHLFKEIIGFNSIHCAKQFRESSLVRGVTSL